MFHLSDRELAALRWVDDDKSHPRAGDILYHGGAMMSIRDRGFIKFQQRPGWRANVLTAAGQQALVEHTLKER